jgi:hypothetical protein
MTDMTQMKTMQQITFSFTEVTKAMIIKQGIHEGFWGIYFEFGILGANVGVGPTPDTQQISPAAIVPINKIGIQRFEKPNSLTIDAAEVNPK